MPTLPLIQTRAMDSVIAYEKGHPVSVREFLCQVNYLAKSLPDYSKMLNLCDRSYPFMVGFCAALVSGKTNVLPPNRAPETLKSVADQFEDIFCLTGDETFEVDLETIVFPSNINVGIEEPGMPQISGSLSSAITFTSGSTGSPRPQIKTWQSMVAIARHTGERLITSTEDTYSIVATVPPQHMYGLETAIMLPLQYGCALYSGRPFFPEDIREALENVPKRRVWVTTPLQIKACVAESLRLPDIDIIISATAHLPEELAAQAEEKFGARVIEIYGCTEAGSIATRRTVEGDEWLTLDEINLKGSGSECFVQAPYLNGPVLLHDIIDNADGRHFTLRGRTDDLVNIEGKRASLENLNHHLNQIEGVVDGVIFIPQEANEEIKRLAAFVVAPGISLDKIIAELRLHVDPAFLPRPLYLVDSLPRSESGKLPREKLMELFDQRSSRSADII